MTDLGLVPDTLLAERFGVSASAVHRCRKRHDLHRERGRPPSDEPLDRLHVSIPKTAADAIRSDAKRAGKTISAYLHDLWRVHRG